MSTTEHDREMSRTIREQAARIAELEKIVAKMRTVEAAARLAVESFDRGDSLDDGTILMGVLAKALAATKGGTTMKQSA